MTKTQLFAGWIGVMLCGWFVAGCGSFRGFPEAGRASGPALPGRVQGISLNDPITTVAVDGPITMAAAKNEWTSFAVQVSDLPANLGKRTISLNIRRLAGSTAPGNAGIDPSSFTAYQILPMPIDVNRAGFVRHTGLGVSQARLPRALLPIPISNGTINPLAARDPAKPSLPRSTPLAGNTPLLFWIDLHIPAETRPGDYTATCDLVDGGSGKVISSVPIKLTVYDFVLPDERHLAMVSRLEWDSLRRLYPQFETVEPRLISRTDKRYDAATHVLDQLMKLAQVHRTQLIIPELQPIVKWPDGQPPQISWSDYDSMVSPWLKGYLFMDKVPLVFWPLPESANLDNYPVTSRLEYWAQAAAHFDQLDWLKQSVVFLERSANTKANESAESIELSILASRILNKHPRVRVMLPLEESQVSLADQQNRNYIDPTNVDRLFIATPGLVSGSPLHVWPKDVPPAMHWLRTDLPGLIPYVGAGGDQHDVRLWAWLAFLRRQAQLILWSNALPHSSAPNLPADPNELIWFYPGSWFGVSEPVPSIQLKWLRRAQQDYEYLWLAKQSGQQLNAMLMARLITKPVEIQPTQPRDPTYALMSGTTNPQAWTDAIRLLAKNILLQPPGQQPNRALSGDLDLETLRWAKPQERPTILGRGANWSADPDMLAGRNGAAVDLRLGIDIYNASDATPDTSSLQWHSIPTGWVVPPQPLSVPSLATYRVQRFSLNAQVDPNKIVNTQHRPIELTYTEPVYKLTTPLHMVIPVATSDRHPPGLQIDGSLDDWTGDDAIQNGPMVQFLNRPAVQSQQMQMATTSAAVYTGWSDRDFYVSFKVQGLSTQDTRVTKNFVEYPFRRAWGEDLCEVLIQPIYRDNSVGPVLHVVVKPNGSPWTERKGMPNSAASSAARSDEEWPAFEGAGIRYATKPEASTWRGEIAIPWPTIAGTNAALPMMLRFNFSQHRTDNGESASWAGPIDFGRDDAFMGLLLLRDPAQPAPLIGGKN